MPSIIFIIAITNDHKIITQDTVEPATMTITMSVIMMRIPIVKLKTTSISNFLKLIIWNFANFFELQTKFFELYNYATTRWYLQLSCGASGHFVPQPFRTQVFRRPTLSS